MIPGLIIPPKCARHGLSSLLLAVSLALARATAATPSTGTASPWNWQDARTLAMEGKGWTNTASFYDRLPGAAQPLVRPDVWTLSQDSAGMAVHFTTDATTIAARWSLRRSNLAMPHMPATGVSGVDLYVREAGHWRWLANGRPEKTNEERVLVRGLPPGTREYLLYLPLYNGVNAVSVGVPEGSTLAAVSRTRSNARPIAFYGTSIVQGGCASRPGLAYPAILGRRLDRPTLNLGFSGNALSEPEVATLFAALDPAVFVLDPLPNMSAAQVAERCEKFILCLRAAHPTTPIVLVEHLHYADDPFVESRRRRVQEANVELRKTYDRLRRAGQRKLYYVPAEKLIGTDGEATVDGTHPTDLGFMRLADALEPTLRRALRSEP